MKKKKVKKVAKKKTGRPSAEVVIRVEQPPAITPRDLEPQVEGGKYMIPKTWMSERQVVRLVQKTPPQHVYTRPGKGGQRFSYVTGNYVEKVLNFVFGWAWDFEIVDKGKEGGQVWVQGKLTVKDDKGHTITKSQFGRAEIKFLKNSKEMVDYGNDLKAASTDALKKCASLLGIASDIYGKAEFKQEANVEIPVLEAPKPAGPTASITRPPVKTENVFRCQVCAKEVPVAEAEYSQRRFGKILCRDDQANKK